MITWSNPSPFDWCIVMMRTMPGSAKSRLLLCERYSMKSERRIDASRMLSNSATHLMKSSNLDSVKPFHVPGIVFSASRTSRNLRTMPSLVKSESSCADSVAASGSPAGYSAAERGECLMCAYANVSSACSASRTSSVMAERTGESFTLLSPSNTTLDMPFDLRCARIVSPMSFFRTRMAVDMPRSHGRTAFSAFSIGSRKSDMDATLLLLTASITSTKPFVVLSWLMC